VIGPLVQNRVAGCHSFQNLMVAPRSLFEVFSCRPPDLLITAVYANGAVFSHGIGSEISGDLIGI
jgi:hypothetical protein